MIYFLFNLPKHLKGFQSYLSSCSVSMSFIIESKKGNRMSFLGKEIICDPSKCRASVYCKTAVTRIYTHFDSFLLSTYNMDIIHILLYNFFHIYSNWTNFHLQLVKLTDVFKNNGYP